MAEQEQVHIPAAPMNGLDIWEKFGKPPAEVLKPMKIGPLELTSVSAYWQIHAATQYFGMPGEGWGWEYSTRLVLGDSLVVCDMTIWYLNNKDERCEIKCSDAMPTVMGSKPDPWCFKKVVTGTLTKGLSMLGFAGKLWLSEDHMHMHVQQQGGGHQRPPPQQDEGGFDEIPFGNEGKQEQQQESGPVCPQCGGPTARRNGKFGPFWGCMRYPECKGIAR